MRAKTLICPLAFLASCVLAAASGPPTKPDALSRLAQQYREVGLPLPPASAPLLLPLYVHTGDDGKRVFEYVIGFRLTAADGKSNPGTFLVGTEVWDPTRRWKMDGPPIAFDPDKSLTAELHTGPAYFPAFPTEIWLSAAAQCEIRGYSKVAAQILERDLPRLDRFIIETAADGEDDLTANHMLYTEANGGDPGRALAAAAWNHWLNAIVEPKTDRRNALARLEKLYATYDSLAGKARRNLLESLRLTVQPGAGRPGSPEALIDALLEDANAWLEHPLPAKGYSNPHLNKLLGRGFAAMPALIAHMEDRRLTRGLLRILDGPTDLLPVGSLVTRFVEAAAGAQLFKPGTRPRYGEYNSAELAREWWAKASLVTEEEYVREHVFPAEKRAGEYQWVNNYCLWIVAHRYPQHLGGIYERLLRERPDLGAKEAAQAIAACDGLGREEKLRLLRMGADQPELERREEALTALSAVDPADAQARLLKELEHLPAVAADFKEGFSPEAQIAFLVRQSDGGKVWRAFEQTARRVSPALRSHLLERVNDGHRISPRERQSGSLC